VSASRKPKTLPELIETVSR
jgi:BRCA1 C Terminus (BRCT) domain